MEKKVIVLNLDYCISDCTNRLIKFLSRPAFWPFDKNINDYTHRCASDDFINLNSIDVDLTSPKYSIWIFSDRPKSSIDITNKWLKKHKIEPDSIYFRGDCKTITGGTYMKRLFLKHAMALHDKSEKDIFIAIDASPDVVQMYKSIGVSSKVCHLGICSDI